MAFHKLFNAVGGMMQEEAAKLGVELPAFPSSAPAPGAVKWLSEARKILLAVRPKGRGKVAWLPACKGLEAYAAAAGGSADGTSLLAFLGRKEQGTLVLMLLTALATDRLYERVEFDAEPTLEVTSKGVELDVLEIKAQPSGIKEAVRQLRMQADILVLALAASNAALLERGPLHVVGTVAMAVGAPTQQQREYWERLRLVVGGKGPAPKAAMQLRIQH